MQLWLWIVAIIVAIGAPCVYLLKRVVADRGGARAHCQCGYDLTGNQSHVCPECGRATTCAGCGYELTGNTTSVCPECGKTTGGDV